MKLKAFMRMAQQRIDAGDLTGDEELVMSADGEGNSYSPLVDISTGVYVADTTWSGEFINGSDYDDEDDLDGVPAVALWPTN